MRNLAKIEVVKFAALAALAGCMICYPRLAYWPKPPYPVWYLEAVLLACGFVLWAFVFAWHAENTKQPPFNIKVKIRPYIVVTLVGLVIGVLLYEFVDPAFRERMPEDYPASFGEWIARTLFSLGFTQLLLVFAPFEWSVRLTKRRWIGIVFTVLFGVFIVLAKSRSAPTQVPPSLLLPLLIARAATAFLTVWLYSRYGVILVWWWSFLIQTRHVIDLPPGS